MARPVARRWGVQLFTVLALLEQDMAGTLRRIAQLGYREVETIGSFGRDPRAIKALLDRFGLVSPSQHIAPDDVYASFAAWTRKEISTDRNRENYIAAFTVERAPEIVADAIAKARLLGQRYVVWPILFNAQFETRAVLDRYLRVFNEAGQACARAGLTFAFHNHQREFARLGNDVVYDLILANTDPHLVRMEMDFYWMAGAQADPYAYFERNKGRYFACHVKDRSADGDFAVVGQGTLDLPRLIAAARAGGVEHFYVEYDRSDDPMAAITASIARLKAMS
jgi:sugar phosphate isomerase/epimerase